MKSPKTYPNLFHKIISSPVFWVIFLISSFSIPIIRTYMKKQQIDSLPVLAQAPAFKLINQDNQEYTEADLAGKISVINFIFTTCPDTCPLITQKMAKLQNHMHYVREFVRLVTITVDPDNDTPEVLKEYANKFKAKPKIWNFLTGETKAIENFLVNGLKVPMGTEHQTNPDEEIDLFSIVHSEKFVILDQVGNIRAYRDVKNMKGLEQIIHDIHILVNSLPPETGPAKTTAR